MVHDLKEREIELDKMSRTITGYMSQCNWKNDYYNNYDFCVHIFGEEEVKRYLSIMEIYEPKIKPIKNHKEIILNNFLELISGKEKKWQSATELLVDYVKDNLKLYTTKDDLKSEVWYYENGVYIPQGRSEVKRLLRDILKHWYSQYIYGLVINKLEVDTFIDANTFFKDLNNSEIPVENGILNVFTKEIRGFSDRDIFFSKLPVEYNKDSTCPKIDSFLESVLSCKEDKSVFYELVGFCLLKDYRFEKAAMLVGNGRNGKDKSLELIKRLLGAENCCAIPLASIKPDSFVISELFGKMANLAGDIGNGDLKDMSQFKALTGRSLISAKRKFARDIVFVNHAKFLFACNELPMVYDLSKGFWDRWVLLEFPNTFVTTEEFEKAENKENLRIRDENIIDLITTKEELSGLLNQALLGLERLMNNKNFSVSKGSEEVKNLWVRKSNSFIAFCMENITEDYEGRVTKKELRKRYSKFCKDNRLISKSDVVVKRVLQDLYGASEGQVSSQFNNYLGERIWEGIKWKS